MVNKKKINKKAVSVGINTIFYILMSIMFIWLIIFGYQKISTTQEIISEQDRLKINNDLKVALEFCSDVLNKGSSKLVKVNHDAFNSVCILGSDVGDGGDYLDDFGVLQDGVNDEFVTIKDSGDNAVLIKTDFLESTSEVIDYQIMDSFKIEYEGDTKCFIDKENKGNLDLVFHCD